jgi:hypothetical protein
MKTEKTNSRVCYEWLLDQDPSAAQYFIHNVDVDSVDKGELKLAVGLAFDWEETTQGFDFWRELNKNWKEYVKDQESQEDDLYSNITPAHYNKGEKEVWEMMVTLFGKDEFKSFCRLNAFKYRMRAGEKTEDPTEDIAKAKWYENKLKELNK